MKKSSIKQKLSGDVAGVALTAIQAPPAALRPNAADLAGDSASESTLAKLERASVELKAIQAAPLLQRALACIRAEDPKGAVEWALKALEMDERNGIAWRLMGIAREKTGDIVNAIACFEAALPNLPDHGEIANDIGRLAYRLDQKDLAAKLFAHFYTAHPEISGGANNLACVLRDQHRFSDAINVLKDALGRHQADPMLWNTLGTVVCAEGDAETSVTFFNEALRIDPGYAKARYNLGNAVLDLGDIAGAEAHCDASIALSADPIELAMMHVARSTIRLSQGRIGDGWDDYEARMDPHFLDGTHFILDAPLWTPDQDLAGKHLLLMGEQGLGDEILFAGTIPDVLEALGPDGKLSLAVEPRLVSLFERSFPSVNIGAHATYAVNGQKLRGAPFTDALDHNFWAPMAAPLRRFRRTVDSFPVRDGFLTPDPARVAHWREVLDKECTGKKVGILWKSMKLAGTRMRVFSPFEQWSEVLKTPGVTFVNLQYGDVSAELAQAKKLGVELWTPPGIDLKNDLDDLAALCCALDLVAGFANATINIAAGCGASIWLVNAPGAWTLLGESDRHLWYPQTRLFVRKHAEDWKPVMNEMAAELRRFANP